MRRRRRARLVKLDKYLLSLGFPLVEYGDETFEPWVARAELADGFIADENLRIRKLSIAFRHIARHRGWMNPYKSIQSLYGISSENLSEQYEEMCAHLGFKKADGLTPAQVVAEYLNENENKPAPRLRKSTKHTDRFALFPQRLMQEDNAYEVEYICKQQGIDEKTTREIINKIFYAISPRGSATDSVGNDVLTGEARALKASLAFQKFRIASAIANLSLHINGVERPLSIKEKQIAYDVLTDTDTKNRPGWADVAQQLGVNRRDIKGIGGIQDGEDRVSNRAPVIETYYALLDSDGGLKKLVKKVILPWWDNSKEDDKEALIEILGNTLDIESARDDIKYLSAFDLIDSFDDNELALLDNIKLPTGRAAYSVRACYELTEQILTTSDNLHEARKNVYGVTDNWRPPQASIGEPVGNPSVDRVLKIVNRYMLNTTKRWGKPLSVNIEHVREGFRSEKVARMYQHDTEQKAKYRQSIFNTMKTENPSVDRYQDSQIKRWEAVQRQGCKCLYCGKTITYSTCELDHIVPRKGVGADNKRTNLAAVCADCNRSKSNILFSKWCHSTYAMDRGISVEAAVDRAESFIFPTGIYSKKASANFIGAVKNRLQQETEDDAPDNRSIESVAWMADELRKRIDWYYNSEHYTSHKPKNDNKQVKIGVFPGKVTALARRLSGIEKEIHFAGPRGKTRLDRRHHAVDAAVISMMSREIAVILNEKNELRIAQMYVSHPEKLGQPFWKDYPLDIGRSLQFRKWIDKMKDLQVLVNDAMDHDRVSVLRDYRLRFGNSKAHKDTIHKLVRMRLGDRLSAELINKASTPALYMALTRCDDYDAETGLPENKSRKIVVNGQHFSANDVVFFFDDDAAQLIINGGSVELGDGFHHVRIYKCPKFNSAGKQIGVFYGMIRVFTVDLRHNSSDDLLSVELPPQSLSMRYAEPRTVAAVLSGKAEFVGHLFISDEIRLDLDTSTYKGQVAEFAEIMRKISKPEIYSTWVVDGFKSPSRFRLRPSYLASEGIEKLPEEQRTMLDKFFKDGWTPSVDIVSKFKPVVIRRNGLGEPRWKSKAGLPVSYRWCD